MIATILFATIANSPVQSPDLPFMIQEEKMARDVYTAFADKYQTRIFSNIAKSEQQHMDAIASLLKQEGKSNPVEGLKPGEFKNPDVQKLYKNLVGAGNKSLLDALKAGATIEDKDISDLDTMIKAGADGQVLTTLTALRSASGNHMRAFYRQIKSRGGDYEPKYLTETEFRKIVGN